MFLLVEDDCSMGKTMSDIPHWDSGGSEQD